MDDEEIVEEIEEIPEVEEIEEPINYEITLDNTDMTTLLESLNELAIWNFALMFIVIGLLFFILIFVSVQAGKS